MVLELVHIPTQRQVDVGALAIEEPVTAYPELYEELKSKVDSQYLDEFVCVTWLHNEKWHGQPDGFYHRARFKLSQVKMLN
jgi:hypothetical protein